MVGTNSGNQLNLVVFELGMRTRVFDGADKHTVVSVQPLVVAPQRIRYTDTKLGQTVKTPEGATRVVGGRDLWTCTMDGSFGVESRGLGTFIGTGEVRLQRFWREIVRLSEAANRGHVDEARRIYLANAPLNIPLNVATAAYQPDRSTFYLNFYDLWHDVAGEVSIPSFNFEVSSTEGGATGNRRYNLQVQEVGPLVTAGGVGKALAGLFTALSLWDAQNSLLESYNLESVTDSLVQAAALLGSRVTESFQATLGVVNLQSDGATGLLNGFLPPGANSLTRIDDEDDDEATDLTRFLGASEELRSSATELADTVSDAAPTQRTPDPGQVRWWEMVNEGQAAGIEAAERIDELHALADAAAFQRVAGKLYGMSAAEYSSLLESTGRLGRGPNIAGSTTHRVQEWDTPESLEADYGVSFDEILELNRLLPNEALLAGTELQIPQRRQLGMQSYIDGLPTFGSHAGRAAWGADLRADLAVDADGKLLTIDGPDVLEQGMEWLMVANADDLLEFANAAPDVSNASGNARLILLRKRIASLLASDRRVASVQDVQVTFTANGEVDVGATVVAINGETVSTVRS